VQTISKQKTILSNSSKFAKQKHQQVKLEKVT